MAGLARRSQLKRVFAGHAVGGAILTRSFVDAAEAFCRWAEGPAGAPASEAETARLLLSELYRRALDLPPAKDCDTDAPAPTISDWRLVYERFGSLPVNFYAVVDPLALPGGEAETGDVADDLADIWSDLRVGLALHNTGRVDDAMREWRSRFDTHWAQHAAEALHALQSWAREHA